MRRTWYEVGRAVGGSVHTGLLSVRRKKAMNVNESKQQSLLYLRVTREMVAETAWKLGKWLLGLVGVGPVVALVTGHMDYLTAFAGWAVTPAGAVVVIGSINALIGVAIHAVVRTQPLTPAALPSAGVAASRFLGRKEECQVVDGDEFCPPHWLAPSGWTRVDQTRIYLPPAEASDAERAEIVKRIAFQNDAGDYDGHFALPKQTKMRVERHGLALTSVVLSVDGGTGEARMKLGRLDNLRRQAWATLVFRKHKF